MGTLSLLGLGALLGARHALEPDHVVAVTGIVSRARGWTAAALAGAAWGVGHTLTIGLVGFGLALLDVPVPVLAGLPLEALVGLMLLAMGIWTLWEMRRARVHAHAHEHDGHSHTHVHAHAGGPAHDHGHARPLGGRSLLVGMVHGLAGSAAFYLLPVVAAATAWDRFSYLLAFGIGSITGMLLISIAVSVPFVLTGRAVRWNRVLGGAAALANILVGALILAENSGGLALPF